MLYIVRVNDNGEQYEYEYGNLRHAEEHIAMEKPTAKVEIYEYHNGQERMIRG